MKLCPIQVVDDVLIIDLFYYEKLTAYFVAMYDLFHYFIGW